MEKEQLIEEILERYRKIRERKPLVHMIASYVTGAFCADAISAVGGRPLMAQAIEEMAEITPSAGALAVNLGQPSQEKYLACREALLAAAAAGLPAALDPVGAGASRYRKDATDRLVAIPWSGVIKGNGSEIHTILTGALAHEGVDSVGTYDHGAAVWQFLARAREAGRTLAIAETGAIDRIRWLEDGGGRREIILHHRSERPVMLVGTGCVAGAVLGAVLAAETAGISPLSARSLAVSAAAAVSFVSFCGERQESRGYGTYKAGFLDSLSVLDEAAYREYLTEVSREERL